MEELTNMIFKFFVDYGWQMGVCAVGGIFVLGFFKMLGIFDGIKMIQLKKFLYIALSGILSTGACVLYLCITHTFTWLTLAAIVIPVFALNQTVYQLYEDLGIRAVWKKVLEVIASKFSKLFIGVKNKIILALGPVGLRKLAEKLENGNKQEANQIIINAKQKETSKNTTRSLYDKFKINRK